MEVSTAEIIATGAVILNILVIFSRVPSKKDLKDVEIRLCAEMASLREEMRDLRKAFTDHLMYLHGDKRPADISND